MSFYKGSPKSSHAQVFASPTYAAFFQVNQYISAASTLKTSSFNLTAFITAFHYTAKLNTDHLHYMMCLMLKVKIMSLLKFDRSVVIVKREGGSCCSEVWSKKLDVNSSIQQGGQQEGCVIVTGLKRH